jgi:hypothetical protein
MSVTEAGRARRRAAWGRRGGRARTTVASAEGARALLLHGFGVDPVAVARERAPEGRLGFLVALQLEVQIPQVLLDDRRPGRARCRPLERRERLVESRLLEVGPPEAVEIRGIVGVDRQRARDERHRLVELAPTLGQHVAQIIQASRVPRIGAHQIAKRTFGPIELARALVGGRQAEQQVQVIGSLRQRGFKRLQGLLTLVDRDQRAREQVRHARVDARLDIVRRGRGHPLAERRDDAPVVAAAEAYFGQRERSPRVVRIDVHDPHGGAFRGVRLPVAQLHLRQQIPGRRVAGPVVGHLEQPIACLGQPASVGQGGGVPEPVLAVLRGIGDGGRPRVGSLVPAALILELPGVTGGRRRPVEAAPEFGDERVGLGGPAGGAIRLNQQHRRLRVTGPTLQEVGQLGDGGVVLPVAQIHLGQGELNRKVLEAVGQRALQMAYGARQEHRQILGCGSLHVGRENQTENAVGGPAAVVGRECPLRLGAGFGDVALTGVDVRQFRADFTRVPEQFDGLPIPGDGARHVVGIGQRLALEKQEVGPADVLRWCRGTGPDAPLPLLDLPNLMGPRDRLVLRADRNGQ